MNMKKVYGKTPKGGRAEHDFYATDPIAAKLLLNVEKFDKNIWECASGENHLADVFKEYGYNVRTSDIVKRTPTTEVRDFLRTRKKWHGDIITNPPKTVYVASRRIKCGKDGAVPQWFGDRNRIYLEMV